MASSSTADTSWRGLYWSAACRTTTKSQYNRWRVTTRKVLRFSDRTPYSKPTGGMDFGQLLNYLAPAAVTWWLETDFYSSEAMGKGRETPGDDQSREKGGRDG